MPCHHIHDDKHALNASKAVLRVAKKLEDLNRQWKADRMPTFRTRFGLHCGSMIVGNIGATERLNYTVLGDAVNVASRLEGLNKAYGTRICGSQALYDRICDNYLLRPLNIVAVKGWRRGMVEYELLASRCDDPLIGATKALTELRALTKAGFDAHLGRRWGESIKIYKQIAERYPEDTVAPIYLARNTKFLDNPP